MSVKCVEMTAQAKSGHPTTSTSISDIMTVLHFDKSGMRYNPARPKSFISDRFVLSKGHGAPILYTCWSENGFINPEDLLGLR